MPSVIETAKTGRAKCRACKQTIGKGELRFGEEVASSFGDGESLQWYHLACAVEARPEQLKPVLEAHGEVPDREKLLGELPQAIADLPLQKVQKAERAPTGRAHCLQCHEVIGKDQWRIAVERDLDVGAGMKGSGYVHVQCALKYLQADKERLLVRLRKKSELGDGDVSEIAAMLG